MRPGLSASSASPARRSQQPEVVGPNADRPRLSSRHNPLVREASALLTPAGRRAQRAFLTEGIKLIGDALDAGARLERAFVAPDLLRRRPGGGALLERLDADRVVETSSDVLASLADTETTQ